MKLDFAFIGSPKLSKKEKIIPSNVTSSELEDLVRELKMPSKQGDHQQPMKESLSVTSRELDYLLEQYKSVSYPPYETNLEKQINHPAKNDS